MGGRKACRVDEDIKKSDLDVFCAGVNKASMADTTKATVEYEEHALDAAREGIDPYAEEHAEGLDVPRVTWWRHKGLRHLYLMIPVLLLSATTNGYDSSLLNGLQTLKPWQDCTDRTHIRQWKDTG